VREGQYIAVSLGATRQVSAGDTGLVFTAICAPLPAPTGTPASRTSRAPARQEHRRPVKEPLPDTAGQGDRGSGGAMSCTPVTWDVSDRW
jgi:hypothetical protein